MGNRATDPRVDAFLDRPSRWRDEFVTLRKILLDCPLAETVKWGWPCYTYEGKNVVLMHGFKDYCALLFFKGALLRDPHGLLVRQTERVRSARQIRFTSANQIAAMEQLLKAYVQEAIEIERVGLKVDLAQDAELPVPDELRRKFEETPALKAAFDALTPGRRRAYLFYFTEPKQSRTRAARIERCIPRILEGKGLRD
ncbi:MAG TPA: YdeI family protein [Calditerricola sp.]